MIMEEFIQEFKAEAGGIIQRLQEQLLLLESDRKNKLVVEEIFRGIHTLKGSSRMFGFDMIEKITHDLENTFDLIRNDKLNVSPQVIGLSLEVVDVCQGILEGRADEAAYKQLLVRLGSKEELKQEASAPKATIYQVLYHPAANSYSRGVNPMAAINELKETGEHWSIDLNFDAPALEVQKSNKKFESVFEVLITFKESREQLEDIFIFLDSTEYSLHEVSTEPSSWNAVIQRAESLASKKLSDDMKEQHRAFLSQQVEKLAATTSVSSEEVLTEVKASSHTTESSGMAYINVKLDRLDNMMNLVSELVTIKAELQYRASLSKDPELLNAVERLEKVTTRFRDNAFDMRLVPLQVLSLKFQRMVRDLGGKLGKEINLLTEGLDTEIDKTIINEIEAPLMHIIRNAIDHGLESTEERQKLGKDKKGLLKIVAFYSGANVFIQIQDDGRGLNLKRIREKAITKGIISEAANLTEREIIDLIFTPGFSTSDTTTEYSGRGVGMDVVRHKLRELRGSIDITTEEGLGTAFTIRLPLSLSILDVLHVKVNDVNYLLPHSEVESCLSERLNADIIQKRGYNVKYKGSLIPHFNLDSLANGKRSEKTDESCIVILNKNDQHLSVEVDSIVGEEQLVIKPVDEALKDISFLSGVAVLGNGELAFLVDSLKLKENLSLARKETY